MSEVVLASTNKGKIAEIGELLQGFGIRIRTMAEFPGIGEIEETGASFTENALLKARAIAGATGHAAIADDSGLVVDALGGAPGIYSARYGNDWPLLAQESSDQRNIRKLLHELAGVPPKKRTCHFETVIAAVHPCGCELIVKGQWQGRILEKPLGENGFGYDPVFWDDRFGKSAAQMERSEKNAISHRGRALAQLLAEWPQFTDCIAARLNARHIYADHR